MAGIEWFCPRAVSRIVRVNQGAQHASQIQPVTFSCPSCSATRAPGCATPTSSALRALPLRLHGDDRRIAGNVPDEADQLPGDGGDDLDRLLSRIHQPPIFAAKANLRLPCDGADVIGDSAVALAQRPAFAGREAIVPCRFDQHGAGGRVACG